MEDAIRELQCPDCAFRLEVEIHNFYCPLCKKSTNYAIERFFTDEGWIEPDGVNCLHTIASPWERSSSVI